MSNLIMAVALLCQATGTSHYIGDYRDNYKQQLACQQWYVDCLTVDGLLREQELARCVKARKSE